MNTTEIILARSLAATAAVASGSHLSRASRVSSTRRSSRSSAAASPASVAPAVAPAAVAPAAAAAARRRRPSSSSSSRPVRFLAPAVLIAAAALLAPKASADQTITSPATWANNYVVGSGTAETVTITGAAALLTTGANVHVGGNVNTTGSTPSSGTLILTEGGRLTGVTLLHLAGTGTTAAANVVSTAVGRIIIGSEDGTAMAGTFAGTGTLEIRGHAPGTQSAPNSLVWFNYVGSSYYMNKGGLSTGANIVLTGATSVKHSSAGTTTLSLGTHSYTGVTLIEKGTLVMRGEKTGQGKTIIAASGTLQVGVGTSSSAAMGEWRGSIENAGNLKFIRSNGFDFTAALIPTITGSGNINFEKTGTAGTLSIRSLIDGATNVTVNGVGAVSIIGTMQNVGTVTIDSRGATSIAALNNVGTVNVYSSAATTISGAQTNVGSYYINSIATTTISNLGTSAANITKFGAGLLSITGVTSGTVTLNGGVLTFTGGTTWVNPAAIITSAGTSLQINRSILNGTTISSVISGGGTLVKQGTASTLGAVNNSVMLSGANTYSGGTRFVGWLYLTGAGTLGTGEVLFAASAARLSLGLNNTDNYNVPITTPLPNTFDGTTAGYGGILKRGTGEVTLTGDIGLKKYIAVLEVNGGILRLGDGGTPPNWGIHNTAGVFIARTAAEAAVGPEGASLVFNHDGYLYPYVRLGAASVVAGHPWRTAFHGYGNLINEGHGITVLMGYDNATDDFSGKLIAKNGTFQIGMGKDRGRVQNASYVIEESGTIAVWRRGDLWTDAQHNAVIANAISGTGTFIKMGTNFVHLTGANNTFSGTYIVEGGGLRFGSGGITNSSADFELQRTSVNAVDKTAVLVVGRSDAIMNFTGNISGVGALRKLGTSTLVLTGNNSYSGGTHIGGGTGSGYAADNVYTTNAGTIQVGNFSVNAGLTGSLGTGTILFSVSNNSNAIGKILINRNGTFEIPGNIMGGNNATAQAPATNPYSSITLSGGSTYPAGELNGVPYEAGVAGDAITILSGNNAFKGSIIVKAGRLILSGDNTKSVGYSSRYTAEPGAILQIGDGSVGGVGGRIYQTGTDTSSAGNTRLTFSGATIEINHADTLIWSRPLSGTASVSSSSDPAYPSYNVSDVSSVFAQTGSGTTILSANNTAYLGTIRIENGRLQIGGDNNLGTSSTNIIKGGTLVLAGSVTFNKNWTLAVGEQENGIEVPSALTATFGGTFSGEGGFTKLGAGTLKLNNDYALGNISVREGVLDLTAFNGDFGKAHGNNYLEGGTLKLGATYLVSGWEIAVPATGKDTIDIDFGASAVMASGMTGAGDFTITGGGTLILGENLDFPHLANLDFSGAVTIDGGQLKLTVPGALGGTVGTPSGAVHQLIDGTLTLSSATPTTYFDNWHVPGRATLQQPIINVRENDVITLSGRLTSDANAPLKFTGNPAMSANPSTLILTNPRTALRGDIEVGSNLTLVFAPPAGGVQIVGTDSSVNEITGGGVIRKQGDGALYINAIFGQATNVEPSLYIDKGTLGGTGTIWNLKDIYVGVRNSFDAVTLDPGSAPNKVGSLSISFKNADVSSDMDANIVFHVDIGETGYDKMDFSNSGSKGFSAKGFAVDIATVGGHYDDDGSGRAIITNIPLRSTFTDSTLYAFKGVAFSGAAGATSNLNASYRFDPDPVYPSGDPPTPISILLRTSSVAARSLTWTTGVGTWTAGYNGWAGGDSTFKHGDTVTFAASDSNDIAVATAGVIVGSMDVSAAGSSYTFTGGAIVGGTFHASDGTSWTTGNLTISNGATATFNNRIDFEEIVIKDAGSKLILGDASVSPAPDTQLTYGQKFYLGDGTSPSGTLEFAKSAPYTFMGLVSGKGTISQTGTGPLTLTGRLNTLGYMDENDAQFAALGRKFEFTGKLFIAAARTIIFDIDEGITQALKGDIPTGNIVLSGSGTLEKIGDGTLALEGLPDFQQGTINVKQGTLYLKADVAGGNSGFHRLGNATLELEGTHSGNWKLESMRSTISVPSGSVAFSGNLTSLADTQLVKAGVGNLILTGNNGYVGDTRIEAGTLTLQGPLDNTPNVPTRPFSDYTGNIYISAGTSLKLENQISSDDINDVRRYQMFSGNIYGTGSIVIDTTPQSMGMSGNMIRSNIYDFNGKVEAPLTVTKGTIGGSGFIQNVTLTSTVTQVDANSPRLASVVISPGNNWIEFEADGAHFKDGTNVIGSLTLGSAAGILTLQNIELLIDVKKGNISDRLLIYGNANWGTGNILNIRTDPNNMEAWDESTYVIARANPDGTKPGEFTNLQATLTNTEIQLNGLPVKNTRLQAALTFADVLTTTKPVGYSSLSAAGANEGAKYSAGGDKSTIILKTKGGVSEVIYWQGYAINGRDNEWTASHNNGALNWKWDGGDGDGARVIAFWDGDAVFFSEKDGPSSSTPGLVGAKNLQIIAETPTNPADPRTVYVASMFVEGKDYTFNGDKITGSMTSSTGADIQATNSLEEFLWLTGKLVITQTGKATFKNDISFFDIAVQGPETTKNPYFENFTPLAATGGEATFEGKTYISSEVLTVGRYATARLAGAGEFLNVTKIAVGNNGKFIFNKDLDYSFDGAITNMPILNTDPSSEAYGSVTAYDGSGSLEKSGSGKVTLSGTHTYDGTTTVSGGILAITGVLGAYEEVAAQETTRQVPHYAKNITLSNGAILSLSPSLPIIYDSEGNPIEEEPFEGMERPEQIIGSASTISGVGTIRKEGTGILTFEANTLPSTVKFEHIAGVLAGGYVGAVVTIPDITFSQGAIISPGARPVRYSSDGPRYSNVSGTGITFNENNKFGRMTFGVAGNTTTFNGIQYDIDINPDNEATSDFIRVVGDAEFGVEAPNTVSLGRVGSFTNKAYVVLGVTGTLTIPANLANTVILYDSAGITDPRNRVALVAGENGHANYVVDGNSYPWNKVLLLRSFIHANIGLTWTGRNTDAPDTLNASWHQDNTEIRNWREDGDTNRYFKQADIVEFPSDVVIGDTPYDVGAKTVNISASGVIVGGMTVSGPGYVFTGNSILGTVNSSDGADPEKTTPNILATNKLTITEDGEAKFENSAVTFARMEVAGKAEFLNPAGTVLNITDTATPIAVSGLLVLKWNGTASPFHADSNKNILLSGAGSVEFNGPGTGGTGQITYPGVISGEGGIGGSDPYAFIKSGDGKIIMSADQSYSGATQVTGGHLEFNGTLGTVAPRTGTEPYIATYDGAIHVADGASLTLQVGAVGKTVVQTVNANVTAGEDATGTLIKTGPGRLNVNGTVATTFQAQAGVLGGTGTFQKGATISAGVLISAGRNNDVTGSVLTFETVGPSSVIIPAGAGMIIDIRNASLSNSIFVTGSLVFGGTEDSAAHPFYVNPIDQDGDWRAGKYLVATATTGITLASGADVLWYDGATVESDSRIGGRLIIIENETTHYKELWLLTYMASRGLVWWGTETGHGTDISDDWDSTTEDWKHFTGTYPPKENLTDPSEMTFFSDGDHALFLNNGAPQEVIVQSAGVKASAMTIGSNSDFTFNGTGKITGRDDIWISDDPNPFNPVNEGGLHIEATGKATFNNTGGLDFSGTILVEGDGTFNSRVTTPLLHVKFDTLEETATYARATLGNDGNFAGVDAIWVENAKAELVLNRTTKAGIYGGPIYGAGKLFKTGAEEMTLSGAVSLTGPITVSGGKLSITGSLGVKTGDDATAVTYTHSTGVISIAAGANLTINTLTKTLNASSVEVDFVQVIDSTAPGHPPTPEDRNYGTLRGAVGSILEIGGSSYSGDPDNPIRARGSHVIIADSYSPFQGNIVVNNGADLKITGRIGVFHDTWDKGTPSEATYWHTNYGGNIHLGNATSKITFASTADYQQISGGLTGLGTIEKSGYFPVYFTGDASGFSGATNIVNGNYFIDTATDYGKTGVALSGPFSVGTGAALYVELWRGNLTLNASTFGMAAGSGLVVRGNGGLNIVTSPLANTVTLANGINLHISVGAAGVDGSVRLLAPGDENRPVGDIDPLPTVAKVSFRSATTGTVRKNENGEGVVLPAQMNLSLAYNPTPALVLITLLDGIDTAALPNSVATSSENILAYLGLTNAGTGVPGEIYIGSSTFKLAFTARADGIGRLMLMQTTFVASVPEPSTYVLWGTGLLVGLAYLRRRKNKKNGTVGKGEQRV